MVREGYKQTEVGVIPVDWEVVELGEVTTKIGSGKTPRGGRSRYRNTGLTFVRSQNIGWGRMILDDVVGAVAICVTVRNLKNGAKFSIFRLLKSINDASLRRHDECTRFFPKQTA